MLMRTACRALRSGSLWRVATSARRPTVVAREVQDFSWAGAPATLQKDWWVQRTKLQWRGVAAKATANKQQQPEPPAADAADTKLVGDLRESDEFLEDLEELEEDVGQEVSTNNLDWGEKALEVARQLLAEQEAFSELELFSLRAIANGKRLDIRLDKMTDLYGSPSLEDIEAFARAFTSRMEACLGEEAAGEIEVEVSSPGAERVVRVPGELERFAELPMKVEFHSSEDPEKIDTRVFDLVEVDSAAGMSRWRLANVRANRQQGGKGRGMNKKQREQVFEVPVASLRRVNLHLDL